MSLNLTSLRERLESIVSIAHESPVIPGSSVPLILRELVNAGFERTIYFEYSQNVPANNYVLVYSASAPSEEGTHLIGRVFPFEETTLGRMRKLDTLVVTDHYQFQTSQIQKDIIEELALEGKCWAVIPLSLDGEFIGQITCVWSGDMSDKFSL